MYAWLFRHLPGPLWIRIIQTLLLLALVVLVLMNYVFPWASQYSPWTDSTVGASAPIPLTD
ncbi:MAG: hypothetical protein LBE25_07105 [Arthrobacter sp.]|jgi:hypothetical protein|nr:hypothetical protein [Arthrobacter sp.]